MQTFLLMVGALAVGEIVGHGLEDLPAEREAANLLRFYNDPVKAMDAVSHQLNVLHGRAQVLVTLAGLAITVCGFSGVRIASSGLPAQIPLILGLAVILFSSYRVFTKVMRIHWLSHFMGLEPLDALTAAIGERNHRMREFVRCCRYFFIGAILYTGAIGHMLLFARSASE